MQFSNTILLTIAATLCSNTVFAAPAKAQQPLRIDFEVKRASKSEIENSKVLPHNMRHSASSSGVLMDLENEYAMYLTEIEVGTPGQKIKVDVDTGSSDLWLPGKGTTSEQGTYDNSASSTYKKIKDGFQIGYGDGSYAKGDWAHDKVKLADTGVSVDLQFGDATDQTSGFGVFGIGMKGNEAALWSGDSEYSNYPYALKEQGYINKVAYSLYLNSQEASHGSVLFGGIDKAKYDGELKTLPLINIDDGGNKVPEPVAFFVNLDSISAAGSTLAKKSYPALLDSGTTLIYAPTDIYKTIAGKYGKYNSQYGGYTTSCSTKGDDFKFTFEDKTITVPFKDLLFKVGSTDTCLVGVMSSGSEYYILGDGFLRSAYIYYDLEENTVGLSQVKYTEETDVVLV